MSGERLLRAREIAELLGLEMATVLDHFEAGDIPGYRLWGTKGGPVRFRLSEVETCLEAWRVTIDGDHENGPAPSRRPGPGKRRTSPNATHRLRPL